MSNIQALETAIEKARESSMALARFEALEAVLALPEMQDEADSYVAENTVNKMVLQDYDAKTRNSLRSSIRAAIDQLIQGELGTRDE